jgi:hypothetical protein
MKVLIERDGARQIGAPFCGFGPECFFSGGDGVHAFGTACFGRELRGEPLDLDADRRQLPKLRHRQDRDTHRPIGRHLKRAIGDKPRHGFAHRHHRDAERLSQTAQR